MKGFRISFVLFTVLLVLGSIAYWDEQQQKKDEVNEKDRSKLFTLNSSEIEWISLVNRSSPLQVETFELKKSSGAWEVVKPVSFKGDDEVINRWIKTLGDLRYEKSFEPKAEEMAAYGLESPSLELTFGQKNGAKKSISMGNKSPTGYSNYLKISGENRVYLVGHYVFTASNKKLNDVRDRGLGLLSLLDATEMEFESSSKFKVVFTKSNRAWSFKDADPLDKLDEAKLKEFIDRLNSPSIESFLDDPSSDLRRALALDHGGTSKVGRIAQTTSTGMQREWVFLENNGVVYVRKSGYEGFATLAKETVDLLNFPNDHFVDKNVFDFNSIEISRVELDGRKFEKIDDQWVGGDSKHSELIKSFLVDLEFLKAKQFLSESEKPSDQQKLHNIALYRGQEKIISFDLYKKNDSQDLIYLITASTRALVDQKLLEHLKGMDQVQKIESMSKK